MKRKIIIRLVGGLGNQLFQYALGCALTEKYNILIEYDETILKKDRNGKSAISYFEEDYKTISFLSGIIWRIKVKFLSGYLKQICCESVVYQHQKITPRYKYLNGSWQNVKYFENIKSQLVKDISYEKMLNDNQKQIITEMKMNHSVAVHIRRGDYLSPEFSKIYLTQGVDYYNNARRYFNERNEKYIFYVFSDDILWCKEHFGKWNKCIFIDEKISDSPYIDFELMRNCNNFIISNSTFSWWASWLSQSNEKIMIAPKEWFYDKKVQSNMKKALLTNYILI